MKRADVKGFVYLCLAVSLAAGLALTGRVRDPFQIDTAHRYEAPGPSAPLGTDALGRDLLARTGRAAGTTLSVVGQSLVLSFTLALPLGLLAGYFKDRWPDRVISWVISLLYTIPSILLVVAVFAVIEPTLQRAYLVIGCIGWAAPARLVRVQASRLRGAPFVVAARAFGFSPMRVLFRDVLPASAVPAALGLLYYTPELVGLEVGLSFFGLGAPPPEPTLGRLIYDGLSEFSSAPWLPLWPSLVLLGFTSLLYLAARRLAGDVTGESAPQ
jgi:peptide/nickel transport system permease protein